MEQRQRKKIKTVYVHWCGTEDSRKSGNNLHTTDNEMKSAQSSESESESEAGPESDPDSSDDDDTGRPTVFPVVVNG